MKSYESKLIELIFLMAIKSKQQMENKMSEVKLCKDCRHYANNMNSDKKVCLSPKLKSVVDGGLYSISCETERDTGLCGQDAVNFEVENRKDKYIRREHR